MAKIVRTARFEKSEINKIELFLKKNPFFDFSSLSRTAIREFISNPTVQVRPIVEKNHTGKKAKKLEF